MTTNLKLVSHQLCPYVQRAAIALTEKGVPFTRENIDLSNRPDWFKLMSPTGKVPLLIVNEAHVLFESAAICDYLDETIEPRLHPDDPIERAQHRAWIEFASGTLTDIWGLYTARDEKAFDGKLVALSARFRRVEETLGDGPFFAGPRFSLVDAAFGPVFRYFDVFDSFLETGVFASLPKLTMWRRRLQERPSVRNAVSADYPARLRSFVATRRSHMSGLMPRTTA
jgi:glutathione S-transferase